MRLLVGLFRLAVFCTLVSSVALASKTIDDYSKESDIFFDVRKIRGGLKLVGLECGQERFRVSVSGLFSGNCTQCSSGNFQVKRLGDELYWQHMDGGRFYQVVVKKNGDIEFGDVPQNYTGFQGQKTYGFRTPGILENRGSQAFYKLILSASQFHNYGTIQTYNYHFFHNYSFNSGVIRSGDIPKSVADLRSGRSSVNATPSYKFGVVENYGKEITHSKLSIEGGLSYHEHGEGVMDNLEMQGGDIMVKGGDTHVAGALSGTVRDIEIANNSSLYLSRFEASRTGGLVTSGGGRLYLSDDERARLSREISDLEKEQGLLDRLGTEEAYNNYLRIKRGERPGGLSEFKIQRYKEIYGNGWEEAAALGRPYGLKGGGMVASTIIAPAAIGFALNGVAHAVDRRHHPSFEVAVGVDHRGNVGVGPNTQAVGNLLRQRRRQQDEESRAFDHIFEPRRTSVNVSHTSNPTLPLPRPRRVAMDRVKRELQEKRFRMSNCHSGYGWWHRVKEQPVVHIKNAFKPAPISFEYQAGRGHFTRLYNALSEASVSRQNISTIWGDPYLQAISNWDKVPSQRQDSILSEYPGTCDITDAISGMRKGFFQTLADPNLPARKYIGDFIIPMAAVSRKYSASAPQELQGLADVIADVTTRDGNKFDRTMVPERTAYGKPGGIAKAVFEYAEKRFIRSKFSSSSEYEQEYEESPKVYIGSAFKPAPINFKYRAGREYYTKLRDTLEKAGVSDQDIATVWCDPYLQAATNWQDVPATKKQRLSWEYPEINKVAALIDDGKRWLLNSKYILGDDATQFFLNYGIPIMVLVAEYFPAAEGCVAAGVGVTTAGISICSRLPQIARAYGAAKTCMDVREFLSKRVEEKLKSKPGVGGKVDTPTQPRTRATRDDADRYLQELKNKGSLGRKRVAKDGYDFFRFERDCEHKGIRFKKGDYISRDKLHNEWEWFQGAKKHKGAIDPITGKLRPRKGSPSRVLKLP